MNWKFILFTMEALFKIYLETINIVIVAVKNFGRIDLAILRVSCLVFSLLRLDCDNLVSGGSDHIYKQRTRNSWNFLKAWIPLSYDNRVFQYLTRFSGIEGGSNHIWYKWLSGNFEDWIDIFLSFQMFYYFHTSFRNADEGVLSSRRP